MQPIKPIAYEILRRDDGMIAISVNAGLIDFVPGSVRIRNHGVYVHEKTNQQGKKIDLHELRAVELVEVGEDVIERVMAEKRLRLFEFASFGMTGAHTLELLA